MPDHDWTESTWIKITATILVLIVGTVSAVVLERMGALQSELGGVISQLSRVDELDGIKERLVYLEVSKETAPHLQASSAQDQYPDLKGKPLEMELVDSISSGIRFDPKRSPSEVIIDERGDYLIIASPQVRRTNSRGTVCVAVWLRVNRQDLRNSSVKECFSKGTDSRTTGVLVLQAILPFESNDVLEVMIRSDPSGEGGAVAIKPPDIPLVPAIIFSLVRVG